MDNLQELKNYISSSKIKVVSFDIFDTLLIRPCIYPTDILMLGGKKCSQTSHYLNIRQTSERLARKNQTINDEEILYSDIYREMADKYDFSDEEIHKLSETELQCEYDYLTARPSVKEIFDYALQLGKKVIIASDIYLSYDFIEKVLKKNGYEGYYKLYLSSEYNLTKSSGRLFSRIIADFEKEGVKPEEILHMGDNENSDVNIPKRKGINAVHVKRIEALAHTDNTFRRLEMFSERNCANTFLLGCSVNMTYDEPMKEHCREERFVSDLAAVTNIVIAPLFVSYAKLIAASCKKSGVNTIYFVNNEGVLLEKILSEVKKYVYGQLKIKRIDITKAVNIAKSSFIKNINSKIPSPYISVISFIRDYMGISEIDDELKAIVMNHGYASVNYPLGGIEKWCTLVDQLNAYISRNLAKCRDEIIGQCGKKSVFYTDKCVDVFEKLFCGSSTVPVVYSLFSDSTHIGCDNRYLISLGKIHRPILKIKEILRNIADEDFSITDENYALIRKNIISYTEYFCEMFKDAIPLMDLNAFQYIEFIKIGMYEFPDFVLKNIG